MKSAWLLFRIVSRGAGCRQKVVSSRRAAEWIKDDLQCITRGANWNALDFAERQNISFVTGYNEFGFASDGRGKNGVVFPVWRTSRDRHVADDGCAQTDVRNQFGGIGEIDVFSQLGTGQNVSELVNLCR